MEAYTISNKMAGGRVEITKGIEVEAGAVALGSTESRTAPDTRVPLSTDLTADLGQQKLLTGASAMRTATNLKLLGRENVESDREGSVLVRINVAPPEGHHTQITRAEPTTSRCHSRNTISHEEKSCDTCGTRYIKEQPDSSVFKHPSTGHYRYYNEHLPSEVTTIGEGHHIAESKETHRELLIIMEPGARLRIATLNDQEVTTEQVLVRTHTELGFAIESDIFLASELMEANAAYL